MLFQPSGFGGSENLWEHGISCVFLEQLGAHCLINAGAGDWEPEQMPLTPFFPLPGVLGVGISIGVGKAELSL